MNSHLILREWLELLLALALSEDERPIFILLNQSSIHELADQVGCSLLLLIFLGHLIHLHLESIVVCQLGSDLLVLEELSLLLSLDLLLSASSLATFLEEIG